VLTSRKEQEASISEDITSVMYRFIFVSN